MDAKITVPDYVRDPRVRVMASASGGKDSTALMLALREADVPFRAVFADTGWEWPGLAEYLDLLRHLIGPIETVGVPGGFEAKARKRTSFPATRGRWCTGELKIEPQLAWRKAWEDAEGVEVVAANGVRAEESAKRATMTEWDFEESWDGFVWRPLLGWSVEDVIAIHKRHGVPMNPLYHLGHDRVGCWPCIHAGKEEIALIAKEDPERIAYIANLERELTIERKTRNDAEPGRYAYPQATFFQAKQLASGKRRGDHGAYKPMTIDEVVRWAQTSHGGRQTVLFEPPPEGGCFRWGVCEPPTASCGK